MHEEISPDVKGTFCKVCGSNKTLETCYHCYLKSMSRWYSQDNEKDTLKKIEDKINQLSKDVEDFKIALNFLLPKRKRIKLNQEKDF